MEDESPFSAVTRILATQFGIVNPSNLKVMMLIEAVKVALPPHREATFDTLRAILRSLHPSAGLESWAHRCADEITSWMAKSAEIRKIALASGEGFWCSIEGTLVGMLLRATRGLDVAPSGITLHQDTIFTREDGTYGWWDETWNDRDGIHYKTRGEAVTAQKKYAEEVL